MSSRVSKASRPLSFTAIWSNGILTCTSYAHGLATGDVVDLPDAPNLTVTVVDVNTFTVSVEKKWLSVGTGTAYAFRSLTPQIPLTIPNCVGSPAIVQAVVSGSGSVQATITLTASLNGTNYVPLGSIILNGTTAATDALTFNALWPFVNASVDSVSGTNAVVSIFVGG